MNKNLCFIFLILFIISFSTNLFAKDIFPTKALIGNWNGYKRISGPLKKSNPDSTLISIIIKSDGSVTGTIGTGILKNCKIKRNRGWLGRWLNIKTDYIIYGGTIEGPVVKGDTEKSRKFTLPFSIKDKGKIKGSIMILKRWKYPLPLYLGIKLKRW